MPVRRLQVTVYVRMAATHGVLEVHRLASDGISRLGQRRLDLEQPEQRARYEAALSGAPALPIEHCRLLDYRRDPGGCWRPGLGLR